MELFLQHAPVTVTDSSTVDLTITGQSLTASVITGAVDHNSLNNLTVGDVHPQYAFLAGRSGGQTFIGGTGTTDDLIIRTTSGNAASGADMLFQTGNNGATEAMRIISTGNVGINTTVPLEKLHVTGSLLLFSAVDNFLAIKIRPNDGNKTSRIQAIGDNSIAHSEIAFSQILPTGAGNPTDSRIVFRTMDAGTLATKAGVSDVGFFLAGTTANVLFGDDSTDTGYAINVLASGGATPSPKGTGWGRNLTITAGTSDNTGGLGGGDVYLRGGLPTSPATIYGNIILSDQGGNTGIGTTSPQGKLHVYDSTGGGAFFARTGVAGTALTLIPDAAGDVTQQAVIFFVCTTSGGGTTNGTRNAPTGGSTSLYSVGGDVLTLAISAGGALTIQRTGGALTYNVSLWIIWT